MEILVDHNENQLHATMESSSSAGLSLNERHKQAHDGISQHTVSLYSPCVD